MSRHIDSDAKYVYRAVVTKDFPAYTDRWGNAHEAHIDVEYCGPFSAKGHASAAISRAKRQGKWWMGVEATVTGEVQQSPLYWEGVG